LLRFPLLLDVNSPLLCSSASIYNFVTLGSIKHFFYVWKKGYGSTSVSSTSTVIWAFVKKGIKRRRGPCSSSYVPRARWLASRAVWSWSNKNIVTCHFTWSIWR
jgi:hypothetical protein